MNGVQCFLLEPTDTERQSLRRYQSGSFNQCPVHGYHNARNFYREAAHTDGVMRDNDPDAPAHDYRFWPRICDCGYVFTEDDPYQFFREAVYKRSDTGERMTLADAPPGAMWDAEWMPDYWKGSDGRAYIVMLPDKTEWGIDSRANNCTKPDDNEHRCWVRHGEAPRLTVDKNGNTCAAGAGSISTPNYHGFLRDGFLVTA